MMQIFEQEEFRGLALEGDPINDPYTSRMELNTETDESGLNRTRAHQPYVTVAFPCNAYYFDEYNHILKAYQSNGTAPTMNYAAASFQACVCFRWDGVRDAPSATTDKIIFAAVNTAGEPAWAFKAVYSASRWIIGCEARQTAVSASVGLIYSVSASIAASSWYWVDLVVTANTASMSFYADGSTTTIESILNPGMARSAFTGTYVPYIGGDWADHKAVLYRGAVAYAAIGTVGSCPSPWTAKIARESGAPGLDLSFNIQGTKDGAYIGKIATASASCLSWVPYPGRSIATATASIATKLLDGIGPHIDCTRELEIELPSEQLFLQKTVFMFHVDGDTQYFPMLRSEDSTFRIEGFASASYLVGAAFTPASATAGTETKCRILELSHNVTASPSLVNKWLAFEFTPNVSAATNNAAMYEWNGATWSSFLTASSSTFGIIPPESSRYYIGGVANQNQKIYDFRVSVGDDSWTTSHTPTSILGRVPDGTVFWLNHYLGKYPRDSNIRKFSTKNTNALIESTIAMSDRIDGQYHCKFSPYRHYDRFLGCGYLTNNFLSSVEDIHDFGSGNLYGVTDGYYFETNGSAVTTKSIFLNRNKARPFVANIGSNKYVCGPGPLQYVGSRTRIVGLHNCLCVCTPGGTAASEANSTLDNRGKLAYTTEYKFKLTLYDPDNGDESNAYGPFRFITDTGSNTCGFIIRTYFVSPGDLDGLEFRAYRYTEGDGDYHLEGSGKISGTVQGASYHYFDGVFTFAMSDDDLVLQPALHSNVYHLPEHTFCTIWNNRSWLVDAYNPSRMFFSEEYGVGNIPVQNLLWTDEGLGGEILGAIPGFGGLLVLKERSIWIVPYFSTDEEATCQQLIPDVGVVGPDAAIFVDGILYFASADGLYVFDGQSTTRISESLNKADLKVWDHDPRGTRAMYDRRNFKIKFWNDGSYVSIDVRNGAIRLGADNDRCVTNISHADYSGPVYGGTGGVFKEASAYTNRGLLGIDGKMPRLTDDFTATTQCGFNTATSALTYGDFGWYAMNANKCSAGALGINTPAGGQLFFSASAGIAAFGWTNTVQTAPCVVRRVYGNFDVAMKPNALSTPLVSDGIIAFSSSTPGNYVILQSELHATNSTHIQESYFSSTGDTNSYDMATVSGGAAMELRLIRQANTFTPYYYSASAWVTGTPMTAVLVDPIYVGPIFLDPVGARSATARISWFYNTRDMDATVSPSENAAVYGPIDITAAGYTSAITWYYPGGSKRIGSIFPIWTRGATWMANNTLVGRELTQWNDDRNDIWTTIIHAVENSDYGVYYFNTRQTDLDEFFIGKRPYYYQGQRVYYGRRADAKMFERLEVIHGTASGGGGEANIEFAAQMHGESAVMTATATLNCVASTNNILPIRLRGNYGFTEIEGYSPFDVAEIKMFRVHYRPIRPRGRVS